MESSSRFYHACSVAQSISSICQICYHENRKVDSIVLEDQIKFVCSRCITIISNLQEKGAGISLKGLSLRRSIEVEFREKHPLLYIPRPLRAVKSSF